MSNFCRYTAGASREPGPGSGAEKDVQELHELAFQIVDLARANPQLVDEPWKGLFNFCGRVLFV
jgi:hypothetical protein